MHDLAALAAYLTPVFPPELWFLPFVLLTLLGLAALVDAFIGRVPNVLILLALAATLFPSAAYEGWPSAGGRFLLGAAAFWILKSANALYLSLTRRDALGMGDAKWTSVAAAAFGLPAVFWAWIFGAWLGLVWMGLRWLVGLLWRDARPSGYLHFAPFLLIGLLAKLYGKHLLSVL